MWRAPVTFAVVLALAAGVCAGAGSPSVLASLEDALGGRDAAAEPAERDRILRLRHQLRNHGAMRELVEALPLEERPRRVLYLASGAHLAPLALCEALPEGASCDLTMTEVDPSVQGEIGDLLGELVRLELASGLEVGEPLPGGGSRTWRLRLGSHPVSVTLRVEPRGPDGMPPRLIRASDLAGADLVVSHDWSGDPLSNLRVVYDLLVAARAAGGRAPRLMIEDLERHPYPVDLSFFSPLARTGQPYGHRTSGAGVGRHGTVELGEPLFGGGVILGFAATWWRKVDPEALEGFFNFLLFNQFDDQRQNVLEGGRRPLVVPALLDWWTGFGRRTISNRNLAEEPGARDRMLGAAAAVAARLEPPLRQRLACRLALYRSLTQLRAAGADLGPLLPVPGCCRTLEPRDFPSDAMESLYDEALANGAVRDADLAEEAKEATRRLERFNAPELVELAAECPVGAPSAADAGADAWLATARRVTVRLADNPVSPR